MINFSTAHALQPAATWTVAPMPAATTIGVLAVFAFGAFALATVGREQRLRAAEAELSAIATAGDGSATGGRARCDTCGIIETMRFTDRIDGKPAAYEFTVLMRDGTRRDSSDSHSGGWKVGDRIILIGGGR